MSSSGATSAPLASVTKQQVNIAGTNNISLTLAIAQARTVELIGATQTLTITFPVGARCQVINSTNFDQTLQKVGATGTLTLSSGSAVELSS